MSDETIGQIAAAERAMDRLDALADAWSAEIELPALIKAATSPMDLKSSAPAKVRYKFRNRMEAQIDAIVKQAFIEAYMRAGDSRQEYDEVQMSHLRAELAATKEANVDLEQLVDLQWKADQRAIKRWARMVYRALAGDGPYEAVVTAVRGVSPDRMKPGFDWLVDLDVTIPGCNDPHHLTKIVAKRHPF